MKTTIYILTAFFLMSFTVKAQGDQKKYKNKKANYEVMFPVKPDVSKKVKKKATRYKAKAKDGIYYYSVSVSVTKTRKDQIAGLSKKAFDAFVKALDGEVEEEKTFKIGDYEGIEGKIKTKKDGRINYRVFTAGKNIYQISVTTAKEYAKESDVLKFFDSFKILK